MLYSARRPGAREVSPRSTGAATTLSPTSRSPARVDDIPLASQTPGAVPGLAEADGRRIAEALHTPAAPTPGHPTPPPGGGSPPGPRLAEPVRRWIWDKGWGELHDIQERAIFTLLDGESDLIIAAPTAGGKTEAAFLPLISSVLAAPGEGGFDLVYVAPLKALINDQLGRMEDLCKQTDLPVYPWHGVISQGVKSRARANPKGILLITPESLEAMFVLRGLQIPSLFMGTRAIIIDELHALLDNERGVHLRSLLSRLEHAVGQTSRVPPQPPGARCRPTDQASGPVCHIERHGSG